MLKISLYQGTFLKKLPYFRVYFCKKLILQQGPFQIFGRHMTVASLLSTPPRGAENKEIVNRRGDKFVTRSVGDLIRDYMGL